MIKFSLAAKGDDTISDVTFGSKIYRECLDKHRDPRYGISCQTRTSISFQNKSCQKMCSYSPYHDQIPMRELPAFPAPDPLFNSPQSVSAAVCGVSKLVPVGTGQISCSRHAPWMPNNYGHTVSRTSPEAVSQVIPPTAQPLAYFVDPAPIQNAGLDSPQDLSYLFPRHKLSSQNWPPVDP
ncbi:hypothetical protein L218DRAFT_939887 [Marasmius fiardii PR-910]|nr:hypothetical protein L218DRAFT_939887 [Marasmius fiardii PR-910]